MKRAYSSLTRPFLCASIALTGLACGSPEGSGFDQGTSSSGGSSGGGSTSSGGGGSGGSGGSSSGGSGSSGSFGDAAPPPPGDDGGTMTDCDPNAKNYIYVISDQNNLYTF